MELRRARPEELDAVGDLTVTAYSRFTLGAADPYVSRLRDARARDREAELWVAAEGGRLLGTVTYCPPGSPWRELAVDGEGEFRMLAVAPDAQRRGVGAALVALCAERATAHGASAMVLSSLADMRDAHRLYERHGYSRRPDLDWDPVPGVHLIAYRLELRPVTTPTGPPTSPPAGPATLRFTVTDDDTAAALGSGSLPVLATPRLLAWLEAATCAAVEPALTPGTTSVGTRVEVAHQAASPVGAEIEVTAATAYVDGRLHRFTVAARHVADRKVLATGEISRVVVDAERFLARL